MNRIRSAVLGLTVMAAAPIANAAVSDAEFEQVKRMLDQALNRISELEAAQQTRPARTDSQPSVALENQVAANTAALEKSVGASKVQINGDLRMRHQSDDNQFEDGKRTRNRLRARVNLVAQPIENVEVGVGLATGSDDPVSTNQTLGGFGSSKGINLDLAYFKWQASESVDIGGGKFKNNITLPGKSQLQWDGDWRPEGFNANYENNGVFARAFATWLEGEEDKRDATDVDQDLLGVVVQTGVETRLAGADLTAGIGYSTFDTAGKPCFDGCGQNMMAPGGVYMYDYNVFDAFVEAGVEVADRPLKFWAQFIQNSDAGAEDSGHQFGVQYGSAKKKGTWQTALYYQELDADATLSAITNSDFAGGGTDNKGIYLGGAYAISDKSNVALSYFSAERKNDGSTGISQDRDTLQVDLSFKY